MHLSLEELLALRDGEGTEEQARHADVCPVCSEKLRGLEEMRGLLKSLPEPAPSHDLWPALREAAEARRRRRLTVGLAAAAGFVVFVSAAVFFKFSGTGPAPTKEGTASSGIQVQAGVAPQSGPAAGRPGNVAPSGAPANLPRNGAVHGPSASGDQAELAKLIRQSQHLESMLRKVEANPGVQSGWQAAAVTDLQDHLASLDGRIIVVGQEGEPRQMVGLWQRRVDLLSTLLQVQTEPQGQVRL